MDHSIFNGATIMNNAAFGDLDHFLYEPRKNEKLFMVAAKHVGTPPNLLATFLLYAYHKSRLPQIDIDIDICNEPRKLLRYLQLPTVAVFYMKSTKNNAYVDLTEKIFRTLWPSTLNFTDRNFMLIASRYQNALQPLIEFQQNRQIVEILQHSVYKRVTAHTYVLASRCLHMVALKKLHPSFGSFVPLHFLRSSGVKKGTRRNIYSKKRRVSFQC